MKRKVICYQVELANNFADVSTEEVSKSLFITMHY